MAGYCPKTCRNFSKKWIPLATLRGIPGRRPFPPPNANLYHYAGNNPVRYVDPTGLAAGDPFDSIEDAAVDWAETYADDSICTMREYGSTIYMYEEDIYDENGKKETVQKFSYNIPKQGGTNQVTINESLEPGQVAVSAIHSHADYNPLEYDDEPSPMDKAGVLEKGFTSEYLVTPLGNLYSFNHNGITKKIRDNLCRDPWADVSDGNGYGDCKSLYQGLQLDKYIDQYGRIQN